MRIVHGLELLEAPFGPVVLTIGNFDGVHVGHQDIIRYVVAEAEQTKRTSVVMTFEHHALRLLAPDRAPPVLMPLDEKLAMIESLGVQLAVVVQPTRELLAMTAEQFIQELLLRHFRLDVIVEGPNFRFGHDRAGTIELLIQQSNRLGFQAVRREPVYVDLPGAARTMVSSSVIRELLRSGQVASAAVCLARPYGVVGTVTRGQGRGRSLGFPTANLETGEQMLPRAGIYAAWGQIDGEQDYPAAVNVGPSPTFDQHRPMVEAFLIGFDQDVDLHGRTMRVKFIDRLRSQKKFDDRVALVEQIRCDVEAVRARLAGGGT